MAVFLIECVEKVFLNIIVVVCDYSDPQKSAYGSKSLQRSVHCRAKASHVHQIEFSEHVPSLESSRVLVRRRHLPDEYMVVFLE